MSNRFEGRRWSETHKWNMRDVAKEIRTDIRKAVKAGELPAELKCSVRLERFSMGCSIECKITAWDGKIFNRTRVAADIADPHTYVTYPWRTDEATVLREKLETIINAYNFDESDSMTDYFHRRYYTNVDFSMDLKNTDREQAKAELAAADVLTSENGVYIQAMISTQGLMLAGEDKLSWVRVAHCRSTTESEAAAARLVS